MKSPAHERDASLGRAAARIRLVETFAETNIYEGGCL